jgi:hypothetical protein
MPRPIHDEAWSTLALARNLLMGLDPSKPMTSVVTPQLRLILQTLIDTVEGKRSGVGASNFAKHVESRIETVGKAQIEHHGRFADEQTYVANKIAAEEAQS